MEEKGVKEMMELIAGLKALAMVGKKAFADGKLNIADAPLLSELFEKQAMLVAAFSGLGELKLEAKDMEISEAVMVVEALLMAVKEVKEA